MATVRPAETLGDLLASRRRSLFVGRTREIELFRNAVGSADPPLSVWHVHGPGGIGKSSLLDIFAGIATGQGLAVVHLDGRDLLPSPGAVVEHLRQVLHVPDGSAAIRAPQGTVGIAFFIDSYERLAALDGWVRTRLLPRLPPRTIMVISGREALGTQWHADPTWRGLLRIVTLPNLSPQECRDYLRACAINPRWHDQIVEVTHGHPLALSLLSDLVQRGGGPRIDPQAPDLLGALLRQFVEEVPSALHRRALEVCALARVTTEPLLRDVLEVADAHELFQWLRGQSFISAGPYGLYPHELARDTLETDLRWRDRDGYHHLFRAIRSYLHGRLKGAQWHDQQVTLFDEKFLSRHIPSSATAFDWDTWGQHHAEPARAGDRAALLELVRAAEGVESAAIAARWWDRQPNGFFVIRDQDDAVRGVIVMLDLTRAAEEDIASDPGTRAAWDHTRAQTSPREGETVVQCRFAIDRQAYQGPSPTLNAVPVVSIQHIFRYPRLAWSFLTLSDPERWDDYLAAIDLPRVGGADFTVAGRRYGLFAHDFRRLPVDAWLDLRTERALARDPTLAPAAVRTSPLRLSQPEFTAAVRQALRDLPRSDLLARNPLLRTRLATERAGGDKPGADTVLALVHEAVAALRADPRADKLYRAVDRTYLRPAATQERAAAALGLPFSTYRRHLTKGVDLVVSWLWRREVAGDGEHD